MDQATKVQRDKQGRLATDREHLIKLCVLKPREKLRDTRYSYVAEELLESLSCIQLENFVVDIDHNDCTSAAMYFQLSPPIDDGLKQILSRYRWDLRHPGQARRLYPEHKGGWFAGPWVEADRLEDDEQDGELVIDRFGGSAWKCLEYVLPSYLLR